MTTTPTHVPAHAPRPGAAAAPRSASRTARRVARRAARLATGRARPLAAPLAVGLVAGLATGLTTASAAASAAAQPARAEHSSVRAATAVPPVVLQAPPRRAAERASRGGARTALPPMTQVTRTVAAGPSFSGRASWYGGSFQGQRTANGETFDTNDYTAASKTLPFGTRLRVCRGDRCVLVRINDRGPYVDGRVLDLSRAAARELGVGGVAWVTATPVERRTVSVVDQAALARQRATAARAEAQRRAAARRDAARAAERTARQARAEQAGAEQARLAAAGAPAPLAGAPAGTAVGVLAAAGSALVQARRRRGCRRT